MEGAGGGEELKERNLWKVRVIMKVEKLIGQGDQRGKVKQTWVRRGGSLVCREGVLGGCLENLRKQQKNFERAK